MCTSYSPTSEPKANQVGENLRPLGTEAPERQQILAICLQHNMQIKRMALANSVKLNDLHISSRLQAAAAVKWRKHTARDAAAAVHRRYKLSTNGRVLADPYSMKKIAHTITTKRSLTIHFGHYFCGENSTCEKFLSDAASAKIPDEHVARHVRPSDETASVAGWGWLLHHRSGSLHNAS